MFGFGRSDKPVEDAVYTLDFHRESLIAFICALDLDCMTLVCQDWGGLLGLTIPMDMADRFEALLIMNTMLATGDRPLTKGFIDWRAWNNANPDMPVGKLVKSRPILALTHWRSGARNQRESAPCLIVDHLGLALCGRPAANFAKRLMLPVSNDTLLRVVRRRACVLTHPLNVIGIDDWAWRRNHRYGSISAIWSDDVS